MEVKCDFSWDLIPIFPIHSEYFAVLDVDSSLGQESIPLKTGHLAQRTPAKNSRFEMGIEKRSSAPLPMMRLLKGSNMNVVTNST